MIDIINYLLIVGTFEVFVGVIGFYCADATGKNTSFWFGVFLGGAMVLVFAIAISIYGKITGVI